MLGVAIGLVGRLKNSVSPYAVLGYNPGLVLDFTNEYYRTGGALTTFDSALTATRAGNATMVDSDGLLKWAPHNLLTYSEQFDNAAWLKSNITVSTNASVAPDGSTTADLLYPTTSGTERFIYRLGSLGQTISIFIKSAGKSWVRLASSTDAQVGVYFNIASGTVGSVGSAVTQHSISPAGNGWFICTATISTGPWFEVFVVDDNGSTTVTANGTDGIYIWGAHLYRSDLGGMVNNPDRGDSYVPTTSAARYLPRRGHHVYNGSEWVNEGLLVESEARTNLIPNSNTFSAATWANANVTVAQNVSGPDGNSSSAWTVTCTATNSEHKIADVSLTTDETVTSTASIFAKAGTARYLQASIEWGLNFAYAVFDLETGLVTRTNVSGTGVLSKALAEDFGGGWYRISISGKIGTSSSDAVVWYISNTPTPATTVTSFSANGTETIFIYGAQLEQDASTPSSYIPTAGATVTRAAETLVIPSANLPWPSPVVIGEELVTNGTFDTDVSGWSALNNGSASVSGQEAVVSAPNNYGGIQQTISVTAGSLYQVTVDMYADAGGGADIRIDSVFGLNTTSTTPTTQTAMFVAAYTGVMTLKAYAITANINAYFDNISVKEINPLSVSIAMDGRMTYADRGVSVSTDGTTGEVIPLLWRLNSSNFIHYAMSTASTNTGLMWVEQKCLGALDSSGTTGSYYSPGINVPFNIASRHGSTFINGAVDGVALTADLTPVALPNLSATNLQLGYDFMGTIGSFRVWADDIGDAGIAISSATAPVITGLPTIGVS